MLRGVDQQLPRQVVGVAEVEQLVGRTVGRQAGRFGQVRRARVGSKVAFRDADKAVGSVNLAITDVDIAKRVECHFEGITRRGEELGYVLEREHESAAVVAVVHQSALIRRKVVPERRDPRLFGQQFRDALREVRVTRTEGQVAVGVHEYAGIHLSLERELELERNLDEVVIAEAENLTLDGLHAQDVATGTEPVAGEAEVRERRYGDRVRTSLRDRCDDP